MTGKLHEVLSRRHAANTDESGAYVFINPRTGERFKRQQAGIKNFTNRLCDKAKVKRFCLSSIRHYVAQHLVKSGANLLESQTLLGHTRATTTDNYLRTYAPDHERLSGIIDGQFA